MTRRDQLHAVSSWLNDLANLTAGPTPLADSKPKIATLAAALGEEFPSAAFNRNSLLAVARACKFFPSYSEICEVLSPWWKDHRPTPIAITKAHRSDADQQLERDREVTESFPNTAAEVRAKIRETRNGFMPHLIGHWYATAIAKHRPQFLGLLPPEWLKEPQESAERAKLRVAAAKIHTEIRRGPTDAA